MEFTADILIAVVNINSCLRKIVAVTKINPQWRKRSQTKLIEVTLAKEYSILHKGQYCINASRPTPVPSLVQHLASPVLQSVTAAPVTQVEQRTPASPALSTTTSLAKGEIPA